MSQPEEKTIKLRKPVKLGSGETEVVYDSLNLREPTAGELDKAMSASSNIGIGIMLIHLISGVPKSAVEKLCQRDFTEANEYLGGFTDDGPTAAEV
ncbi:phage tail assembly protein [Paraburkholderia sp. FT54]|uniref:phage tail assembly protein n=1 Tax=Paraburkholderia sp. FT54 TaxID=3074437 RepID=UPI002877E9FF|nr:phage tail assembly protein [Paraburkholderia sp. FT54]WNC90959.1 phage tail assembly protein [Paraburkholderia sp. FT54]